ncbi:MAG: hypothetical protein JF887_00725 [Candidatus Dormibacteraeota bacterium]|uniref:Uncharacterized protein n=1 Tax=Candidatus Amunia macphersoniae TaxID=3127014 RepID=A0A934NDQ7_9BACT|nr:hypothetical protein [Candidatus Dormibacteraeota bacterium]
MTVIVMACGAALGSYALHEWRTLGATSVVTEQVTTQNQSPAGSGSGPSEPTAGPSPTSPSPTSPPPTSGAPLSPSATAAANSVSTRVTQSRSTPSDGVLGTMLGLATILVLAGAVLPRLLRRERGGAADLDVAPMEAAAARAVTRQALSTPGRLAMRAGTDQHTQVAAAGALAAAATALAVARARQLLIDPSSVGEQLALSAEQIAQARRGVIPPQVWDLLAAQALSDVGAAPS